MKPSQSWALAHYAVHVAGREQSLIAVKGRDRWALTELIRAGDRGCTPIDNPAPRWSAYVHKLREMGVPIETIHEPHGGPFSGTHARYVLRGVVQPLQSGEAA
ncbi:hypothetical protein [Maritimibacter sp. DP1N21-5]|uniref:winged helix domain-containing protein n=1 Tax=Maritimibacter sp. DP1N21-5 TaxID=2836867 RepID=UPI001C47CD66|nr:hypothetical protein [Maritimibacter sp. DP1N21-5]MBV7410326.1 hypothetical protein [Maritimibacter sp. DP1N21-5]